MIRHTKYLEMLIRQIRQHNGDWIQHAHRPRTILVQIISNRVLQHPEIDNAVVTRHSNALAKVSDGGGRKASSTQSSQGRHTWIIPTFHYIRLYHFLELTLAHDGVI